jgi:hypothetical protein
MLDDRGRGFLFAVALALSGCVSLPTAEELIAGPSPHLSTDAPAGIVDGRARFREHFCAASDDCDRWLHRLPDEPGAPAAVPVARAGLQVLFVTGAFSECFGESARPFATAITELEGGPDRFDTVVVGGRSGTEHNAAQIASYLEDHPADPDIPLVLVGYSKGTSDILQFLVDYPGPAAEVDAVVSIAGAVGGSPLADRFGGLYNLTFSHLPSGRCEKGDGDVVSSLQTDTRRAWLADNALPTHVRYYSFAAFTTRGRMARALVPSWELLLKYDRRNDGQLLPGDALLPHSTLLGYLDADHWAVAMHLEDDLEFFAGRKDAAHFPHTALLEAIVQLVGEDAASAVNGYARPGR